MHLAYDGRVATHSVRRIAWCRITVYLWRCCAWSGRPSRPVEQALYVDRTVIRHHAMRRTLWVATPARRTPDARGRDPQPHRARAPTDRAAAGGNGVDDPDAWLADARDQVLAALHEHGPMTARSLGQKVPALTHKIVMAPGKTYSATVSAHTRVLLHLGFEGRILRTKPTGTWINGAYTYAAADSWLDGGLGELDPREAARDLALRWLHAFGPGTTTDLQWWMGWTGATTKKALADCGAVEVQRRRRARLGRARRR